MSQLQLVLTIIGGLFALTAFSWVCILLKKKYPTKAYDERQKQARGTAYQICYWFQIAYLFFMAYLVEQPRYAETGFPLSWFEIIMFSLLIQLILHPICCLLQGAALTLSPKTISTVSNLIFSGIIDLVVYFVFLYFLSGSSDIEGWMYLYLFIGLGHLYLALLHLIQFFRNKRAEQE